MLNDRRRIIAKRLQEAREKVAGLKRSDVAASTDVLQKTLRAWESGDNAIPANRLAELAELYGVSTDYLCGLQDHTGTIAPDKWLIDHSLEQRILAARNEAEVHDVLVWYPNETVVTIEPCTTISYCDALEARQAIRRCRAHIKRVGPKSWAKWEKIHHLFREPKRPKPS